MKIIPKTDKSGFTNWLGQPESEEEYEAIFELAKLFPAYIADLTEEAKLKLYEMAKNERKETQEQLKRLYLERTKENGDN